MPATLFNDSKYTKCYLSIINRAMSRTLVGYKERHHIIPKSMGGSNNSENLVELTAKEHYIVHLLLPYMAVDLAHRKKMWAALRCMSKMIYATHHRYVGSARFYQKAKENTDFGTRRGTKQSQAEIQKRIQSRNGYRHSEETKKKIGTANAKPSGRSPWNKGISTGPRSEELKQRQREKLKGIPKSPEVKAKMKESQSKRNKSSYAQPGWKHSDETVSRLKEIAKNRPRLTCPHCGKEGAVPGMKRYHFDNCKSASAFSRTE